MDHELQRAILASLASAPRAAVPPNRLRANEAALVPARRGGHVGQAHMRDHRERQAKLQHHAAERGRDGRDARHVSSERSGAHKPWPEPRPASSAPTNSTQLSAATTSASAGSPLVHVVLDEMLLELPSSANSWDQLGGLAEAKRLLKETVLLPILIPDYYKGVRQPWRGVLLYGPPGTGKTMLARAVASAGKAAFFNVSPSSLLSKMHGESEKIARELFRLARERAPSIIFFDEVDALLSSRGSVGEHEASRRLKSELLSLIDGIFTAADGSARPVLILGTTNRPWDLDEAMRRRFERRIHVPLPDVAARDEIIKTYTGQLKLSPELSEARLRQLAEQLDGFSGADIQLVCRDAAMTPMREIIEGKSPDEIVELQQRGCLDGEVTQEHFERAVRRAQLTVSKATLRDFETWDKEHGSAST